jgi:hypothetical protein
VRRRRRTAARDAERTTSEDAAEADTGVADLRTLTMPQLHMHLQVVDEVVMDSLPSLLLLLLAETASAGTGALPLAPGTGGGAARASAFRHDPGPDCARAVQATCCVFLSGSAAAAASGAKQSRESNSAAREKVNDGTDQWQPSLLPPTGRQSVLPPPVLCVAAVPSTVCVVSRRVACFPVALAVIAPLCQDLIWPRFEAKRPNRTARTARGATTPKRGKGERGGGHRREIKGGHAN